MNCVRLELSVQCSVGAGSLQKGCDYRTFGVEARPG